MRERLALFHDNAIRIYRLALPLAAGAAEGATSP
jgi:hypothetical protein